MAQGLCEIPMYFLFVIENKVVIVIELHCPQAFARTWYIIAYIPPENMTYCKLEYRAYLVASHPRRCWSNS